VSLLVAAIGAGRMASGWFDGLLEGRELAIGLSVVALIALSYFAACRAVPLREVEAAQP
jgi:high-affinity nickel-transport protein